jgi:hypothetical protein
MPGTAAPHVWHSGRMNGIRVVIAELQLIVAISTENPKDPRLKQLLTEAQSDLAAAARIVTGQDVGPIDT